MRHDLIKRGSPEVVYEHKKEDEKFMFQHLKSNKLLIFSEDCLTIVNLADNKIMKEYTSAQLDCGPMYSEVKNKKTDNNGRILLHCHLIDNENYMIMVSQQEMIRFDMAAIDDG